LGSGACFNPALGLAQSIYLFAILLNSTFAKYIWLYTVIPFVGAIIAALMYIYHNALEADDRRDKRLPPSEYQKSR